MGRIIGHDVFGSIDEGDQGAVAVEALVETGEATQVGWGLIRGDGALAELPNCRRVVAEGVDGSIGSPFLEGYHLQLHEDGGLFQFAIGQGARGVVLRDQCSLDVLQKGDTPDVSLVLAVEELLHPCHFWRCR